MAHDEEICTCSLSRVFFFFFFFIHRQPNAPRLRASILSLIASILYSLSHSLEQTKLNLVFMLETLLPDCADTLDRRET